MLCGKVIQNKLLFFLNLGILEGEIALLWGWGQVGCGHTEMENGFFFFSF